MLLSDLAVDASLSAPAAPLLLIDDLHFAYPDGRAALRGVRLRIARGEKVALVGPNGAGKSTLLLHLNGILRGKGRIEVAGLSVNDHTPPQVRARVGLVFQNADDQLFSPTVFEDVAFGPLHMGLAANEVRARVERALTMVWYERVSGTASVPPEYGGEEAHRNCDGTGDGTRHSGVR